MGGGGAQGGLLYSLPGASSLSRDPIFLYNYSPASIRRVVLNQEIDSVGRARWSSWFNLLLGITVICLFIRRPLGFSIR